MSRPRHFLCRGLLIGIGSILSLAPAFADIQVVDDVGIKVTLQNPARRIISLAPHVTELLYAAGAGDFIVGAVEYSDFPEAAKRLPRVGSGAGLDMEKIIGLRPDLVIAWQSGNPLRQTDRLRQLGLNIFMTEPRRLEDVARLIEQFGKLAATEMAAEKTLQEYRRQWTSLQARYAKQDVVTVFYQILDSSLLTVSHRHLISDVIRICGGENVFSDLPGLIPRVDTESVLKKNPDVVLASGIEAMWPSWREHWQQWPSLSASSRGNLYFIPPDLIHRNSPRVVQGAEKICAALELARKERSRK